MTTLINENENIHDYTLLIDRLRSFGVKPILDYSVEEDLSQVIIMIDIQSKRFFFKK